VTAKLEERMRVVFYYSVCCLCRCFRNSGPVNTDCVHKNFFWNFGCYATLDMLQYSTLDKMELLLYQ